MEEQTMGQVIARLRKERGMTQKDLAERMHVTDKAVSKWERDLSCPDVGSLPQLARELGVTAEVLLDTSKASASPRARSIVDLILKALPLAMGAAVVVLPALKALDAESGIAMLGIGLFCVSLSHFKDR